MEIVLCLTGPLSSCYTRMVLVGDEVQLAMFHLLQAFDSTQPLLDK